jgi:hypothetical protein
VTQFHQTAQYRAVTGHRNGSDIRQQEQCQRRLTSGVFVYEHRGRRQPYMPRAAGAGVADRADPRMLPHRDSHRPARAGDELGEQPVRDDQQRHVVLASRVAPTLGLAIWQPASPTVSISATDPDDASGIETRCALNLASPPATFTDLPSSSCAYVGSGASVSPDGAHTLYAASQDPLGNTESPVRSRSFKLDQTLPTISAAATTQPNGDGWYRANVTVHFTCADTASGVPSGACPADQVLSTEGSTVGSTMKTVVDAAGNTSNLSNVVSVAIDKTPPDVSVTGVTNGAAYSLGSVPTAGCSTTDALSGVATQASLQVTGGTANGVGTYTATCDGAQDNAGNTASATASYSVSYVFSGFFQPVDAAPVLNLAIAGRSIPLKWRLTDAQGNPVLNLTSVTATATSLACSAGGATSDQLEEYAAGGSGLQNLGNGNYQYNWATPKSYASSCKTLKLDLAEGSSQQHTALFQFTK